MDAKPKIDYDDITKTTLNHVSTLDRLANLQQVATRQALEIRKLREQTKELLEAAKDMLNFAKHEGPCCDEPDQDIEEDCLVCTRTFFSRKERLAAAAREFEASSEPYYTRNTGQLKREDFGPEVPKAIIETFFPPKTTDDRARRLERSSPLMGDNCKHI